ncbi:hypothetical protein BH09PAT4_BH09PAT4_00070 [soil metagenome]
MKVTVVPAQVTTVEDRIMGSLGFSQMLLLIVPVFIGAALFAVLPPAMGSSVYKFAIMGILALVCCTLAIRIRGKIVALWLVTIVRYNLRPKYYLFNKNVTVHREEYRTDSEETQLATEAGGNTARTAMLPKLGLPETARVLATIENPAAKLRFETTKKGGLHVRLTEIED